MARFPIREYNTLALAQDLTGGFTIHADIFPSPPIKPEDFRDSLAAYQSTRDAYTTAQAHALEALTSKQAALDHLTECREYRQRQRATESHRLVRPPRTQRTETSRPMSLAGGDGYIPGLEGTSGRRQARRLLKPNATNSPKAPGPMPLPPSNPKPPSSDQPRGKPLEYRVIAENKASNGRRTIM